MQDITCILDLMYAMVTYSLIRYLKKRIFVYFIAHYVFRNKNDLPDT